MKSRKIGVAAGAWGMALTVALGGSSSSLAQPAATPPAKTPAAAPAKTLGEAPLVKPVPAAAVGNEVILAAEVNQRLSRKLGQQRVDARSIPQLQAQTLEELINETIIYLYLTRQKLGAPEADVKTALDEFVRKQITPRRLTMDDYLARTGLTPQSFVRQVGWELGWPKYLQDTITEEKLIAFFEKNRRELDGTEMKLSHILFRVDKPVDKVAQDEILDEANKVRDMILSGKIEFGAAARQFSAAPSRGAGGDLGWTTRQGVMQPAFLSVAFKLKKGETSKPIATQFGVHLIHCDEIKDGTRAWSDIKQALGQMVAQETFTKLLEEQRKVSQDAIRYTGEISYFDPQTKKFVLGRDQKQRVGSDTSGESALEDAPSKTPVELTPSTKTPAEKTPPAKTPAKTP